jgi:hypothetical protein
VVVLAARLEQVRMVGDELGDDAGASQRRGNGLLPQFDRTPRPPQEVERPDEHVVPRRHARQRAAVVLGEANRSAGEAIEVRRVELGPAVAPEQMTVQRVEENDDGVVRGHEADSIRPFPLGLARGYALYVARIVLLGFPVSLGLRARQHREALLREFAIIAMGGGERADVPKRLLEIAAESDERYGGLNPEADAAVDLAIANRVPAIDLELSFPDRIGADTAETMNVLLEVDEYCRTGDLLTTVPDEAIKLFWIWFLGEFVRQINGVRPMPWPQFARRFDF